MMARPISHCSIEGCARRNVGNSMCEPHYRRWKRTGSPMSHIPIAVTPDSFASLRAAFDFYLPGSPPPEGVIWAWPGSRFASGYGRIKVAGRTWRAHRAAYELFVGPIPNGSVVRHKNDTPIDVNPNNLELGTIKDNAEDRTERERGVCGERHHSARLTGGAVRQMRDLHARGISYKELGRRYGVSDTSAKRAVEGLTWKHV